MWMSAGRCPVPKTVALLYKIMLPLLEMPWKCECRVVLKSPHRLWTSLVVFGNWYHQESDYHKEKIFKSIHFI